MKAYFLQAEGAGTRLEAREVPQPKPGPGQVLVKIHATSLNRGEYIVGGLIKPGAAKPAGQEAAGEIVGSGKRVMGRCPGGFAEYGIMEEREMIPVPDHVSWEEAAAIPLTFTVVHDMLVTHGALKSGEALLVTGVSSGVGVAALQAGKALGARVFGTSGSEVKLKKLAPLGLDVPLLTRKGDFGKAVMDGTGGKGADLAINTVGGSVFPELVRAAAFQGRIAIVGYVDKQLEAPIDLEAVHVKRLRIFGVSNKQRNADQRAEGVRGFVADFLPLFASGKVKPLIDKVFAFDAAEEAKAYMEADRHVGKIVVRL